MQSQDPNTRTPGVVTHPDTAQWMAFLYGETPAARRRELDHHLACCADCAAQVRAWRGSQRALDDWALPPARRPRGPKAIVQTGAAPARATAWLSLPALKWAAAATLALALAFGLGRRTAPGARDVVELRASVAQLAQAVQREHSFNSSNNFVLATTAAAAETLRLLSEYATVQDSQRAADQQNLTLALDTLNARLDRQHAELETVAVNTEDGFQQAHQNLARLASYSPPGPDTIHPFGSEPK